MGMSASQARLLTITARIHDVEFQAQSIQNAKIQLANQSDRVYDEYVNALDATTLTLNAIDPISGNTSTVTACFRNLCSRSRALAANGETYALRDKRGRLIVEEDIMEAWEEFNLGGQSLSNGPHAFAMFMLGYDENIFSLEEMYSESGTSDNVTSIREAEQAVYAAEYGEDEDLEALHNDVMETLLEIYPNAGSIYDTGDLELDGNSEQVKAYKDALNAYKDKLYSKHAGTIYGLSTGELDMNKYNTSKVDVSELYNAEKDFNTAMYNYFVSIYRQIEACGGCVSIEDYNGPEGDASTNSDWLKSMIESGEISLNVAEYNTKTGKFTLEASSPSSESVVSYTETSQIDSTAVAKAEAKYEHAMRQIDKKDKEYDLDLAELDTERQALTKEYESVKTVIDENIERTFGIFS